MEIILTKKLKEMSDWKNDRAEAEMKRAESEMMQKAAERKKKEEDEKWNEIKESLYVGDSEDDKNINWVINILRDKYELPKIKI